jgi:transcriptional regulator with XRE-family HTH domain
MTETKFLAKSPEDVFAEVLAQIPQSVRLLSEYKFTLSDRLEKAMEDKGLKQCELANLAQKAESVISHILAADKNLTLRTIAEISAALGIDLLRIAHFSVQRWVAEVKGSTAIGLEFEINDAGGLIGIKDEGIYA